ncbi:MAG: carbohydrate porin [Rhizomicrobium sp.]
MRLAAVSIAVLLMPGFAAAEPSRETWSLHGQFTNVWQYHPAFRSSVFGPNSLDPGSRGNETIDATLFAGLRLWDSVELFINPEIDQGFGLSNTLGVAGFTSGEAYKVGKSTPYFRLQRLFGRVTFDLGGDTEIIAPGPNQLGGGRTADNVVITFGKISVGDIFDANSYAHDPRADFLNWSLIDSGAFDYAADAWGYSYGVTAEWTQDWWTARLGLFDLSRVPNSTELETGFDQFELVGELEERHTLLDAPGKAKLLVFLNRGRMGAYSDAVALGAATGSIPDTASVRHYASRAGLALNIEQEIDDDLGIFARASLNDGSKEAYEFTEINSSLAAGASLKGTDWGRPDDIVGLAAVTNGLSQAARSYFAAGGLGILIGDGSLARYNREDIIEVYYSAAASGWLSLSADYQWISNPAYNATRGPVSVLSLRLHAAY